MRIYDIIWDYMGYNGIYGVDKSEDGFNEYYGEMPWAALKYEDRYEYMVYGIYGIYGMV